MNKKTRIVSRRSVVLTMALMSKYLFCKNEKDWFVFEFDLRKINWEGNGKMKKSPNKEGCIAFYSLGKKLQHHFANIKTSSVYQTAILLKRDPGIEIYCQFSALETPLPTLHECFIINFSQSDVHTPFIILSLSLTLSFDFLHWPLFAHFSFITQTVHRQTIIYQMVYIATTPQQFFGLWTKTSLNIRNIHSTLVFYKQ